MKSKKDKKKQDDKGLKPDPKTLHKTDPQDNMEGPISSVMQNIKEGADDEVTKEEADKEKDENM